MFDEAVLVGLACSVGILTEGSEGSAGTSNDVGLGIGFVRRGPQSVLPAVSRLVTTNPSVFGLVLDIGVGVCIVTEYIVLPTG